MAKLTKTEIEKALKTISTPDSDSNLMASGLVSEIALHQGHVTFAITITPDQVDVFEPVRQAAEQAVAALPGVEKVSVVLTADKLKGKAHSTQQTPPGVGIGEISAIIAVASGKGGVGKSTVAVNLALGLAANGLKVGLLDADIYGPSVPRMMGLSGRPEMQDEKIMLPKTAYDLKVMSIGFLVEESQPVVWRGPMATSALNQMLTQVKWGALDVLVVDMPPGTGDVQLSMTQHAPLAGAVIVSTPQDIALVDARKGLAMFEKVSVPVLGIIENMSYFLCPYCGERSDIFSHGGAEAEAEKLKIPFLGAIPLHIDIRKTSDSGEPITATQPHSPHARMFQEIASSVAVAIENARRPAPKITV